MSNQAFIEASRRQLRFSSTRHQNIAPEDLWKLPLKSLDEIGQIVIGSLKQETTSLLENPDPKVNAANVENEIRLEVIKTVIAIRQDENKAAVAASANLRRKEMLKELLDKKRIGALEEKSIEELQAELASLG